jgi:hypothetical protein
LGGAPSQPYGSVEAPEEGYIVQAFLDSGLAAARLAQAKAEGHFSDRLDVSLYQDFQQDLESLGFDMYISKAGSPHKKEPSHGVLDTDGRFLEGQGQPDR